MRRCAMFLASWLLLTASATAGEQPAKVISETWDTAYLQGVRAGYVHTLVQQFERDDAKLLRGTVELRLNVKRFNGLVHIGMDTGTFETADGRVMGVFMRHLLGQTKQVEIVGIVKDGMLHLTLDQKKPMQPAPWNDKVIGVHQQQRLFKDKQVKPGDEFEYLAFEPSINLVLVHQVKVHDYEEVELFGGKMKKRLLRVSTRPEKIENVQLPTQLAWLDEDRTPLRSEAEIPVFGKMVLYRTTKEIAQAPTVVAKMTDVAVNQLVKLGRAIPKPHDTTEALYRITIRDEEDPGSTFSQDDRQKVLNVKGNTIDLLVRSRPGESDVKAKKPGDEFAQSSYFINSADARVRDLARKAVGAETDPFKKAYRIEKWVHANMKGTYHESLATADHVARTLQGDCTEFAMLTAAMCRAEGIPSRTAVGLVYADVRQMPVFSFHMWTEAWLGGRWLPLDATLGRGRIGATHLKVTDSAWEGQDLLPVLPVVRVLGKLSIEVLRTER